MKLFEKYIKSIEKIIIIALVVFMIFVLIVATAELGIIIIQELTNQFEPGTEGTLFNINELIKIFGFFLNILIGLELFETVKLYLKENVFHGEIILLVGLIAISRKVIILDYTKEDPMTIIAIALLIGTISLGYYLLKKTTRDKPA
ncbi:MAG: phosphate-starvation-inducible PsiE family protein [Bacteroidales bacterium]|nr:phosphate-starvation-inducible PsiE family protein [Bacteroidales bacterium]